MSFPSKAEREKCWSARDVFWKCLDDHKGDAETEMVKACTQFRAIYESSCPSQWVKHFDRKREYLKFKDRIQKDGLSQRCDEGPLAVTVALDSGLVDTQGQSTSSSSCIPLNICNSSAADEEANSSTTSEKCPSPNTRIYRKFQPPTFTYS